MIRARGRRVAGVATAAVCALALAGCLGETAPSVAPSVPESPDATPTVTHYQLEAQVWYAGMILTIHDATATLDPRGGPVAVRLTLTNPSDDAAEFDPQIRLVVGTAVFAPNHDSTVPDIPANGSADTTLTYDVDRISDVAGAFIQIGDAPDHLGVVPFPGGPSAASNLQPVTLKVGGNATAADLRIGLHTGELRWDLPDWQLELPANRAVITLGYDATYVGSFSGGFAFTGDNVALRLPNGTVVEPRPDGHSQSVELIGPGKVKRGLSSRFEIPAGLSGTFALLVKSGSTTKPITFTVPR